MDVQVRAGAVSDTRAVQVEFWAFPPSPSLSTSQKRAPSQVEWPRTWARSRTARARLSDLPLTSYPDLENLLSRSINSSY